MPNYITHALCANDAIQGIVDIPLKKTIQENIQVYTLGSSGPDFIFYYRTFPWLDQSRNKDVHAIGQVVHSHAVNAFYKCAIEKVLNETNCHKKEILVAYLSGHLMHYALDTCAHPFVFFRSGEMKGKTKYWHYRYESMIDTLMVKQIKKIDLAHIDAIKLIDSSKENRKIISEFYAAIVHEVYQLDDDALVYEECFETMPEVVKWLFDPHNLKFSWIQSFEKIAKQEWMFSSHMVIGKMDKEHDILNLNHQAWNHPCVEEEISTESFIDLYQKAVLKGQAILYALSNVVYELGSLDKLLLLIGNLSYDTGKEGSYTMNFYGSVYEDH